MVFFKVAGLGLMSGNLSIKASYAVESGQTVSIQFLESTLVSKQQAGRICMGSLMQLHVTPVVQAMCFSFDPATWHRLFTQWRV